MASELTDTSEVAVELSEFIKAGVAQTAQVPKAYSDYFIGLSKQSGKVPEQLKLTPEQLSKGVSAEFEKAAQSDNTPLEQSLNTLKIGQALYKNMPEPPFWAVGFARYIPSEQTTSDSSQSEEDTGPNDEEQN